MSDWVGILASRRAELAAGSVHFGDGDMTDEDVLSQVIYEAIAKCIEADDFAIIEHFEDEAFDYDTAIIRWVEAQVPPPDSLSG